MFNKQLNSNVTPALKHYILIYLWRRSELYDWRIKSCIKARDWFDYQRDETRILLRGFFFPPGFDYNNLFVLVEPRLSGQWALISLAIGGFIPIVCWRGAAWLFDSFLFSLVVSRTVYVRCGKCLYCYHIKLFRYCLYDTR